MSTVYEIRCKFSFYMSIAALDRHILHTKYSDNMVNSGTLIDLDALSYIYVQ